MFSVFKNINRFASKSKLLDAFEVFCAKHLLYVLMVFLLVFSCFVNDLKIFFYPLLSGLFSAFVITKIIYILYKEKRPANLKGSTVLIKVPSNPSFPSRHAALIFGMSFCLFFFNDNLAIIFLIFSCFIGIGRVFCGVHWFRDIIAGALVGFLSSLVIYSLFNYLNF